MEAAKVLEEDVGTKKLSKKKTFKSPNVYVTLFSIIVVIAILTWIIPGGEYQLNEDGQAIAGTYQQVESNPQGIWQVLMAPIVGMIGGEGFSGAIGISLFVMLFGSLLEMMDRSGAIKIALRNITMKNQHNSYKLISILVIIMGILGTVEGAYEEGFVYMLMIMPVILGMGMDPLVALAIVVLGTQAGCLASTINPFAIGVASEIAGISPGDGLLMRAIMLVVFLAVTIIFICRYADKVKKNPKLSPQFFRRQEDLKEFPVSQDENTVMSKEQKRVLQLFIALFTIMIIALIPWDSLNSNWTFFIDFNNWLIGIPIIGTILGTEMVPFGQWYFNELSMLILVVTFLCGVAMHMKAGQIIDVILKGAGSLVGTALIIPLARGIQVVMNEGMITPTILHFGETALGNLSPATFAVVSLLFYLPLAALIPSSTGLAAATMSIMASLSRFALLPESLVITAYAAALGIAKMIAPTSIVVMTGCQLAHVSYTTWIKYSWKFVLGTLVLSGIFLYIGTLLA
ncbi:YfcC family protein [Bacillus tuaregi]|uniref:YfcC family protein n=1 Tax=Bacillus tuaregi TaxID=1816695 RepID=UPI0008F86EAD|nr:YfcC family protein [Bacillus tuaregi]